MNKLLAHAHKQAQGSTGPSSKMIANIINQAIAHTRMHTQYFTYVKDQIYYMYIRDSWSVLLTSILVENKTHQALSQYLLFLISFFILVFSYRVFCEL